MNPDYSWIIAVVMVLGFILFCFLEVRSRDRAEKELLGKNRTASKSTNKHEEQKNERQDVN
ncbi:hypothetical protein DQG23_25760 [Paenibacillus contaminans]|uniref:Uncharacterized protein n=1 Tax=Paenibacillus contaminans TaxID=450362 RepID=A0A329ME20_9BACL|nr:hypothetical protein DQG23_25760 [Paenibacillus contaminans]